jgi:hypothetical protein
VTSRDTRLSGGLSIRMVVTTPDSMVTRSEVMGSLPRVVAATPSCHWHTRRDRRL